MHTIPGMLLLCFTTVFAIVVSAPEIKHRSEDWAAEEESDDDASASLSSAQVRLFSGLISD